MEQNGSNKEKEERGECDKRQCQKKKKKTLKLDNR